MTILKGPRQVDFNQGPIGPSRSPAGFPRERLFPRLMDEVTLPNSGPWQNMTNLEGMQDAIERFYPTRRSIGNPLGRRSRVTSIVPQGQINRSIGMVAPNITTPMNRSIVPYTNFNEIPRTNAAGPSVGTAPGASRVSGPRNATSRAWNVMNNADTFMGQAARTLGSQINTPFYGRMPLGRAGVAGGLFAFAGLQAMNTMNRFRYGDYTGAAVSAGMGIGAGILAHNAALGKFALQKHFMSAVRRLA